MEQQWQVIAPGSVRKSVLRLRPDTRLAYVRAITDLSCEGPVPRHWDVKKLRRNCYRLRLNYRYRLVYQVEKQKLIITIVYAGHRKEAYR